MKTRKHYYCTTSGHDAGIDIAIRSPDRRVIASVMGLSLYDDGSGIERAKADAKLIVHALNASLIASAPELLEAAETALTRFAWVIDKVTQAVGHLDLDERPQEAIELLDEVTSSEYFKQDIEAVQFAIAEAKGLAA